MSFFLDPPALFLIGFILYPLSKRLGWTSTTTMIVGGFVSLVLFMAGSGLLYLDILRWDIPGLFNQSGSSWMFHSDVTGIAKAEVPVPLAIALLALYPVWMHLGYHTSRHWFTPPLSLSPIIFAAEDLKCRKRTYPSRWSVIRDKDPRKAVREAVSRLGGMNTFVKVGDSVMIKVNISGGNPAIPGSFTSLDVTDEVVKMVREVGGNPLVCDSDMIWTEFDSVAREEGYVRWAKRMNVPLVNLARTDCAFFEFPSDSAIGSTIVSRKLVDADVVISLPTMKTHLLTTVTLGMKCMYGAFPEKDKAKYHKYGIEQVVFEVARAFTPNLTVIDGSIGGEAYGPLSSTPVHSQVIFASTDVVAADSLAAQLMGYHPLDIVHIRKAHEAGVGNADVKLDFSSLAFAQEKDGKWERPDPEAAAFYDSMLETALMFPGIDEFFNLVADFFLFGTATLPVFQNLTPIAERVVNDIAGGLAASRKMAAGPAGKIYLELQRFGRKVWAT